MNPRQNVHCSQRGIVAPKINIDRQLCIKCGFCVEVCPETAFAQKRKGSVPRVVNEEACISCGHCVDTCPAKAIAHRDFT